MQAKFALAFLVVFAVALVGCATADDNFPSDFEPIVMPTSSIVALTLTGTGFKTNTNYDVYFVEYTNEATCVNPTGTKYTATGTTATQLTVALTGAASPLPDKYIVCFPDPANAGKFKPITHTGNTPLYFNIISAQIAFAGILPFQGAGVTTPNLTINGKNLKDGAPDSIYAVADTPDASCDFNKAVITCAKSAPADPETEIVVIANSDPTKFSGGPIKFCFSYGNTVDHFFVQQANTITAQGYTAFTKAQDATNPGTFLNVAGNALADNNNKSYVGKAILVDTATQGATCDTAGASYATAKLTDTQSATQVQIDVFGKEGSYLLCISFSNSLNPDKFYLVGTVNIADPEIQYFYPQRITIGETTVTFIGTELTNKVLNMAAVDNAAQCKTTVAPTSLFPISHVASGTSAASAQFTPTKSGNYYICIQYLHSDEWAAAPSMILVVDSLQVSTTAANPKSIPNVGNVAITIQGQNLNSVNNIFAVPLSSKDGCAGPADANVKAIDPLPQVTDATNWVVQFSVGSTAPFSLCLMSGPDPGTISPVANSNINAPSASSFFPATIPADKLTTVTITGTMFTNELTVEAVIPQYAVACNTNPASDPTITPIPLKVNYVNPTTLTLQFSAKNAVGTTYRLCIRFPSASPTNTFIDVGSNVPITIATPNISGITPTSMFVASTTLITISGRVLEDVQQANIIVIDSGTCDNNPQPSKQITFDGTKFTAAPNAVVFAASAVASGTYTVCVALGTVTQSAGTINVIPPALGSDAFPLILATSVTSTVTVYGSGLVGAGTTFAAFDINTPCTSTTGKSDPAVTFGTPASNTAGTVITVSVTGTAAQQYNFCVTLAGTTAAVVVPGGVIKFSAPSVQSFAAPPLAVNAPTTVTLTGVALVAATNILAIDATTTVRNADGSFGAADCATANNNSAKISSITKPVLNPDYTSRISVTPNATGSFVFCVQFGTAAPASVPGNPIAAITSSAVGFAPARLGASARLKHNITVSGQGLRTQDTVILLPSTTNCSDATTSTNALIVLLSDINADGTQAYGTIATPVVDNYNVCIHYPGTAFTAYSLVSVIKVVYTFTSQFSPTTLEAGVTFTSTISGSGFWTGDQVALIPFSSPCSTPLPPSPGVNIGTVTISPDGTQLMVPTSVSNTGSYRWCIKFYETNEYASVIGGKLTVGNNNGSGLPGWAIALIVIFSVIAVAGVIVVIIGFKRGWFRSRSYRTI